MLDRAARTAPVADRPEGAQLKVNMLLRRLPRLRDSAVAPEDAFAGTFHVNETYSQLEPAFTAGRRRRAALAPVPCEIYCHSLTDPTHPRPDSRRRRHTLTLFALHTPARLFEGGVDAAERLSTPRSPR